MCSSLTNLRHRRQGDTWELEADHLKRAVVEDTIRDIKRHLISIGLVVIFTLVGACWMSVAAARESTGARSVTSVPHPMPDPHP